MKTSSRVLISMAAIGMFASTANAADYTVNGYLSAVESYGSQMSFFLSGSQIAANACGVVDRFAISPSGSDDTTYKAQLASLMAAYAAGKYVHLRVTDSSCSGDRTRITYFRIDG